MFGCCWSQHDRRPEGARKAPKGLKLTTLANASLLYSDRRAWSISVGWAGERRSGDDCSTSATCAIG
jgi:hypothetical protein